jgi:nucleoside-diphosphate-sugar epimerase
MRVLITGGAGFIGSWLCERLVGEGYRVICIDNLSTGTKKNIEGLDIRFIEHDVREPLDVEADFIYHLASRASPVDFPKYPIDILLTNSVGTYNMLRLANKNGARFLLASTSEVYGDPLEHPQSEGYRGNVSPIGPRACYDESKRFAEALTMAFHREQGLDVRIARIFNTYGPRMRPDDGRVISNFATQALGGKPITVYGDGRQTRSLCYVSDTVDALLRLMSAGDLPGEVVNIGNPNELPILEVADMVKKIADSDSEVVFRPLPQDEPRRRCPDITKAKEVLKWEPRVGLEEGLSKTIAWFKA